MLEVGEVLSRLDLSSHTRNNFFINMANTPYKKTSSIYFLEHSMHGMAVTWNFILLKSDEQLIRSALIVRTTILHCRYASCLLGPLDFMGRFSIFTRDGTFCVTEQPHTTP